MDRLPAAMTATWGRDHTSDVTVKTLAFDIEAGQQAQIGMMQAWLTS